MKRKRGHNKKGKSKKRSLATTQTPKHDDNYSSDGEEFDDDDGDNCENIDRDEVVEAPIDVVVKSVPPPLPPRPERPPPVAVYGRVKLKLKTTAKPQPESSEKHGEIRNVEKKEEVRGGGVNVGDVKKVEETLNSGSLDGNKSSGGIKVVASPSLSPKEGENVGVGKNVEEIANLGSLEGNKSSGGIKVVASRSLSPHPQGVKAKDSEDLGLTEGKKPGGVIKFVSSENPSLSLRLEKEKEDSENSGLTEGKKPGGVKIVSPKSPILSPRLEKEKEEEESENSGLAEGKKPGGVIKIVSMRSPSLSSPDEEEKEMESLNLVSTESKKSGEGIRIMSPKRVNLSPPDGNEKEKESQNSGSTESKKSGGGIKIVSHKSPKLSPPGWKEKESGASGVLPEEEEKKEVKPKTLNKKELEASLEVVTKTMKMDAAGPFNVPVNPIELGIPDYFDVISTPMDFGTVRRNLESGTKYMDSEDVYKDVQYIWDNCFKYNNKGDYIVDLMKRVKKGFMKYWEAAGLYTDQSKKIYGAEISAVDEPVTSKYGKKFKKGKGYKLHKDDCMCAICIMRRRRREREAQEAREAGLLVASPQIRVPLTAAAVNFKQEENSHAESPGEDTSSCMGTSLDRDADVEMEDGSAETSEKSLRGEPYAHVQAHPQDDSGSRIMINAERQQSVQLEGQAYGYLQQRDELLELEKKRQRLRLLETFRDLENPMLSSLCGSLFPEKTHNVWNGPNSLVRCQRPSRRSDILEAVSSFVNPS